MKRYSIVEMEPRGDIRQFDVTLVGSKRESEGTWCCSFEWDNVLTLQQKAEQYLIAYGVVFNSALRMSDSCTE